MAKDKQFNDILAKAIEDKVLVEVVIDGETYLEPHPDLNEDVVINKLSPRMSTYLGRLIKKSGRNLQVNPNKNGLEAMHCLLEKGHWNSAAEMVVDLYQEDLEMK